MAVAILALMGCGRAVKVVVPNAFSGEARVVFDPEHGGAPEHEGLYYVYRIPPSGELRVRDQALFFRFHHETVRYADGTEAPVARVYSIGGSNGLTSSTEFPGTSHVWVIQSER